MIWRVMPAISVGRRRARLAAGVQSGRCDHASHESRAVRSCRGRNRPGKNRGRAPPGCRRAENRFDQHAGLEHRLHIALQVAFPILYRLVRQARCVHRQRHKESTVVAGAGLKAKLCARGNSVAIACMFERLLAYTAVVKVEARRRSWQKRIIRHQSYSRTMVRRSVQYCLLSARCCSDGGDRIETLFAQSMSLLLAESRPAETSVVWSSISKPDL
jgi:hypothetical protein